MIAITYIGHATTLIESGESQVLTDPHFGNWVLALKRQEPLNYDPGKLPELSAVVISHAHHDHLDFNSFKYIKSTVPVFVPIGIARLVSKYIRNPVIELRQFASHRLPNGTEITATPAKHVGFRWTGLRYRQCNSYMIAIPPSPRGRGSEGGGARIFFAGDTAYSNHFKEIGQMFGAQSPIDAALLPIASYSPVWFMKHRHTNPAEAIEAFLDLGAKKMVPIHFGTFKLSAEKMKEPLEWLTRLALERELGDKIHILKSGERVEFE